MDRISLRVIILLQVLNQHMFLLYNTYSIGFPTRGRPDYSRSIGDLCETSPAHIHLYPLPSLSSQALHLMKTRDLQRVRLLDHSQLMLFYSSDHCQLKVRLDNIKVKTYLKLILPLDGMHLTCIIQVSFPFDFPLTNAQ